MVFKTIEDPSGDKRSRSSLYVEGTRRPIYTEGPVVRRHWAAQVLRALARPTCAFCRHDEDRHFVRGVDTADLEWALSNGFQLVCQECHPLCGTCFRQRPKGLLEVWGTPSRIRLSRSGAAPSA